MKGLIASGWHKGLRNEQEIDTLLQHCREDGITDLLCQVYMRGTVLYPSQFAPPYDFGGPNEFGEKKHNPNFDSLQYLLDHKGEIKIHAYMTMLEVGKHTASRFDSSWLMKNSSDTPFLDPTVPAVREYLVNICREVAQNYPSLEGMYLEKLRYPSRVIGKGNEQTRSSSALSLIENISTAVKLENPNLVLSYCSNLNQAYIENVIFYEMVDWRDLLARGVIDKFIPTIFRSGNDGMEAKAQKEFESWLQKLNPANTIPIIGACDMPLDTTMRYVDMCIALGFGFVIYSYGYFSSCNEKRVDFKEKLCLR